MKLGEKMIKEFKEFISRGNVLDLAVGVIIGGAFTKIVNSLVGDVIMPIIGIISGGTDFSSLTLKVNDATINYGMFLQNIIDFLIIGASVFIMIKFINKLKTPSKKVQEEIKEEIQEIKNKIKKSKK